MATVVLQLPPELYDRLRTEAERIGKTVEELVGEWLAQRLTAPEAPAERARVCEALHAAGLLAELSPEERERAAHASATLEEVQAAFARAGGKPLSEIVLDQRGPKE